MLFSKAFVFLFWAGSHSCDEVGFNWGIEAVLYQVGACLCDILKALRLSLSQFFVDANVIGRNPFSCYIVSSVPSRFRDHMCSLYNAGSLSRPVESVGIWPLGMVAGHFEVGCCCWVSELIEQLWIHCRRRLSTIVPGAS